MKSEIKISYIHVIIVSLLVVALGSAIYFLDTIDKDRKHKDICEVLSKIENFRGNAKIMGLIQNFNIKDTSLVLDLKNELGQLSLSLQKSNRVEITFKHKGYFYTYSNYTYSYYNNYKTENDGMLELPYAQMELLDTLEKAPNHGCEITFNRVRDNSYLDLTQIIGSNENEPVFVSIDYYRN